MLADRRLTLGESLDLLGNCVVEWMRVPAMARFAVPLAASALVTAAGRTLYFFFGDQPNLEGPFVVAMIALIVIWIVIGVRAGANGWLWAQGRLGQTPPLTPMPVGQARIALSAGVIIGVLLAWSGRLNDDWWALIQNPVFPLFMVVGDMVWPAMRLPNSGGVRFTTPPPDHPLGLT